MKTPTSFPAWEMQATDTSEPESFCLATIGRFAYARSFPSSVGLAITHRSHAHMLPELTREGRLIIET